MPAKWQLKHRFFHAGAHLPKREKWSTPAYSPSSGYLRGYRDDNANKTIFRGRAIWGFTTSSPGYGRGNLSGDEYRWFVGHPYEKSNYAQCRVCLSILLMKADRQAHGKAGCNMLMSNAIRRAHLSQKCLVCEEKTSARKWGIPLCLSERAGGSVCQELWRFDVCQPSALREFLLETQSEPKRASGSVAR